MTHGFADRSRPFARRSGNPAVAILASPVLALALASPQESPPTKAGVASESIEDLRARAERGEAAAQCELGNRLRRGVDGDQDLVEAFAWARKAADQGYVPAYAFVGLHHLDGLGTVDDDAEAVKWFRLGVDKGDAGARYYLAVCLQEGSGIERNLESAFQHYQIAARSGHAPSLFEVAMCLEHGTGTTADRVAARAAYEKAVAADHVGAMGCLGNWLVQGVGGDADLPRGMELLKEADERGDGWAATLLGDFHREGRYGMAKDLALAEACYVRAAERNEVGASRLRRHFPGRHLELVDQSFDLSLEFDVGKPLLIEIERESTTRGSVRGTGPKGSFTLDLGEQMKSQLRLVDEFLELGDEWKASRYVVSSYRTRDGKLVDDELTGAELLIGSDPRSDGNTVALSGGRLIRKKLLELLLAQVDSAGVDVRMPHKARIGERLRLELDLVLPLLFGSEDPIEEAVADVELKRFDDAKLLAELSGRGTARERIEEDVPKVPGLSLQMVAEYEFDVALVVDLARRGIASIDLKGHGQLRGSGKSAGDKVRIGTEGTLDFVVKLRTKSGPAAAQARRERPKFRDVERDLEAVGVRARLVSHFFDIEADEETTFLSNLGEGQAVMVALRSFPIGTQAMVQAMKDSEAALLQLAPAGTKPKDVKCGIGKGRGLAFESDGEQLEIEIYPLGGDRILRLRISGTPAAKRAVRDELARFRASLAQRQ